MLPGRYLLVSGDQDPRGAPDRLFIQDQPEPDGASQASASQRDSASPAQGPERSARKARAQPQDVNMVHYLF